MIRFPVAVSYSVFYRQISQFEFRVAVDHANLRVHALVRKLLQSRGDDRVDTLRSAYSSATAIVRSFLYSVRGAITFAKLSRARGATKLCVPVIITSSPQLPSNCQQENSPHTTWSLSRCGYISILRCCTISYTAFYHCVIVASYVEYSSNYQARFTFDIRIESFTSHAGN